MQKFDLKVEELEVAEFLMSDTATRVVGVISMIGLVSFGVTLT